VSVSLRQVADIELALGDLPAAREKYAECLAIARALNDELGTPDSKNSMLWSVHLLASCLVNLGALVYAQTLVASEEEFARDLEASCGDDQNILDTCAAYWETRASLSRKQSAVIHADVFEDKARGLRARINYRK
jgi:hypothetical protein